MGVRTKKVGRCAAGRKRGAPLRVLQRTKAERRHAVEQVKTALRLASRGLVAKRAPRRVRGQMTIELAVAMPVLIVVAAIAVNAMTFFADCAVFDRVACEAVRVYAAAPAYGQDAGRSLALVEQAVADQMNAPNLSVSAGHGVVGADFDEFKVTLAFQPTLFGMGLRSEVFGVALPSLTHEVRYVVDSYKPGVFV